MIGRPFCLGSVARETGLPRSRGAACRLGGVALGGMAAPGLRRALGIARWR
jgi:hypothetical protein